MYKVQVFYLGYCQSAALLLMSGLEFKNQRSVPRYSPLWLMQELSHLPTFSHTYLACSFTIII